MPFGLQRRRQISVERFSSKSGPARRTRICPPVRHSWNAAIVHFCVVAWFSMPIAIVDDLWFESTGHAVGVVVGVGNSARAVGRYFRRSDLHAAAHAEPCE